MDEIKNRIKRAMLLQNMTSIELSNKTKIPKSSISQYLSGYAKPKQDRIYLLAEALNVSEAWLMGYDVSMEREERPNVIPPGFQPLPKMSSVPLVGQIACGEPILAQENIEETISLPDEWHANFALICKGDSMSPTILDGDLVAVRIQPEVENGEIAAVRIGNEATLKRVYLHSDYIELRPENPAFESIIRRREEMNDIQIEGKAVGFCRGL